MKTLIAVLAVALSGCTTVAMELGAGYDTHLDQGTNPRSVIGVRAELEGCFGYPTLRCVSEYRHNSSIFSGKPFNRDPEDLTNQYSIFVAIPIWQTRR